jgi:hypothetical protein
MILYHVTLQSNLGSILKNGLIPRIGERSEKLNEKPGIFLFPSVRDMENALLNWLGEEYEDIEEPLVSLKITLPDDFPLEAPVEFERVSRRIIDHQYIEFFRCEG